MVEKMGLKMDDKLVGKRVFLKVGKTVVCWVEWSVGSKVA